MSKSAGIIIALLASHNASHVSGFAPSSTMSIEKATSINFRHVDEGDVTTSTHFSKTLQTHEADSATEHEQTDYETFLSRYSNESSECSVSLFPTSSALPCHLNVDEKMPTWLTHVSGHLASSKLDSLREAMVSSYLSHVEAETVVSAIKEAAAGDVSMMAGASDFCHILVDTMEMGATTLVAAAFHYCECFVARQRSIMLSPSTFSSSEYWTRVIHQDQKERRIKFGDDSDQIVKAAARLKRTEMVAGKSLRSKPTREDCENISKMLLSDVNDWRALAIRSAGCLYRLRGIYESNEKANSKVASPDDIRTAKEALGIHAPLASRLGMHRLKNEIEGAAFRVIYRRQYEKVEAMTLATTPCNNKDGCIVSSLNEGMGLILRTVKAEIEQLLQKDPCFQKYADDVKVYARIKEPYSLWKKMTKLKATQVLDVPDAVALRVVLEAKKLYPDEAIELTSARETALCYYALKKCTNTFEQLHDGRFKDYIAHPKPNGYQSLHYTAFTEFEGQSWPFEIQLRSREMHQVAEFGLAAHWDYKVKGKVNNMQPEDSSSASHYAFKLDQSSDAYLRSVQDWHWQHAQSRSSWRTDSSSTSPTSTVKGGNDTERSERVRARDERLAPYLDALMTDQSNLTREQVFIFLESQKTGVTLALPAGSCVLDALRESERTLGFCTSKMIEKEVVHNGSLTSLTNKLCNGDILHIPAPARTSS